jgi:hypothetical protein
MEGINNEQCNVPSENCNLLIISTGISSANFDVLTGKKK